MAGAGVVTGPVFRHLNPDWNAEPNAPALRVTVSGDTLELSFLLNPFAYEAEPRERGILRFAGCSRWRRDPTNDHGWFAGEGRFSGQVPRWGELYEVIGDDSRDGLRWETIAADRAGARQFIFYFRDAAIECIAADWSFSRIKPAAEASPGS